MAPLPHRYEHSIIAQCTPHGSGALALIRLSGSNAIEIADKFALLGSGKSLRDAKTHTIHYGWVVAPDGTHIDQVLFLLMHAPRTFTGQDTIEITCHNNPFIIEQIISLAIKFGARMADRSWQPSPALGRSGPFPKTRSSWLAVTGTAPGSGGMMISMP